MENLNKNHKNLGMKFNKEEETTWITFADEKWQETWHQVLMNGKAMKWDSHHSMEFCRENFGDHLFGIASTSQMLISNACRDNF